MKKTPKVSFKMFLNYFPEIELPATLTETTHHSFASANKPLPQAMIDTFISPVEKEIDDYTEFVPCFRIAETEKFYAIIYWKASLMTYEYSLVTYSDKGAVIDKKIIAGTAVESEKLVQSVATIDDEWLIHIVGGVAKIDTADYDPKQSQMITLELMANGKIVGMN